MVKYICIILCVVVVALDVTAGILGLKAEDAQAKVKHLRLLVVECKEPSHDAYVLGLAAAVLLGAAHVLAHLLGGSNIRRLASKISVACLVLIWVVMGIGMFLLVTGTKSNHKSRTSCGLTHHNFLAAGGIFCIVHAALSVAFYFVSVTGEHSK